MAYINKKDSNGTKPLLTEGELGYDKYTAGGDVGRVYVGTGSENIALAKKSEVDSKVVANTAITGATKTKITYDSKGLVTSGADLVEADIPTLSIAKTTGLQTALDSKVSKVTSTDNAIVRFDGTAGQIQNSGVVIDDSGNMIAPSGVFTSTRNDIGAAGVVIDFPNYQGTDGRIMSRDTNSSAYKNLHILASTTNFVNGGFTRITITPSGNILVGTTIGNGVDKLQLNGSITIKPLSSATPINNGELTFEATSNTSVKIKLKGSDSVVRSATLTLSE